MTKEAEIISEKNESWTGNCGPRAIATAARIKTLIPKLAYFNKFEKSVKKPTSRNERALCAKLIFRAMKTFNKW